jgi:hypothetical protein
MYRSCPWSVAHDPIGLQRADGCALCLGAVHAMKTCESCKELDGAQAETPPHAALARTGTPLYLDPSLEYFICPFCLTVLSRPAEKSSN